MASTRKLLECVPDGNYDYKPHEKSMTLGRLAGHVAALPSWAVNTVKLSSIDLTPVAGPGFSPFIADSKQRLLAITLSVCIRVHLWLIQFAGHGCTRMHTDAHGSESDLTEALSCAAQLLRVSATLPPLRSSQLHPRFDRCQELVQLAFIDRLAQNVALAARKHTRQVRIVAFRHQDAGR
jgi:hypothetical protein